MKNVLAIQSHVVYGFAGNKSATFPMQLLGVDVCIIPAGKGRSSVSL